MERTRRSLYYVAGYLLVGGVGFLALPQTMLTLFRSTGVYHDAIVRLAGLLLLALGMVVVQLIRHRAVSLYPTTLFVRGLILAGLAGLYVAYRDPLLLVLAGIVALGVIGTGVALARDRTARGSESAGGGY